MSTRLTRRPDAEPAVARPRAIEAEQRGAKAYETAEEPAALDSFASAGPPKPPAYDPCGYRMRYRTLADPSDLVRMQGSRWRTEGKAIVQPAYAAAFAPIADELAARMDPSGKDVVTVLISSGFRRKTRRITDSHRAGMAADIYAIRFRGKRITVAEDARKSTKLIRDFARREERILAERFGSEPASEDEKKGYLAERLIGLMIDNGCYLAALFLIAARSFPVKTARRMAQIIAPWNSMGRGTAKFLAGIFPMLGELRERPKGSGGRDVLVRAASIWGGRERREHRDHIHLAGDEEEICQFADAGATDILNIFKLVL